MTMEFIFDNYYKELTQNERDVITTTDYNTTVTMKFEDLDQFKSWAEDMED